MSTEQPLPPRAHSARRPPGRYRAWRARRKEKLAARSKLRRRLTRTGIGLVLLIVVVVGAGFGYYTYRSDQVTHVTAPHIEHQKGPAENILLIGSTSRCAASSVAVYRDECVNGHVNGINSDVVLVAHLDPTTDRVSLLSIPRDTFVPAARSGSALCGTTSPLTPGTCSDKVDAALVEGPDQLVAAIEQDFGIPINHFVDLNFATFTNVVNALGGLKMDFPDRLYDAENPPLKITRTGCLSIDGTQALALVRSRHLYYFTGKEVPNYAAIQAATNSGAYLTPDSGGTYDGSGDLGRIIRVHLFLKALAQQVAARGLGNPLTDNSLIGAVAPNLTVDSGLSTIDMVHLLLDFRRANFASAPELTLPTLTYAQTYYYDGGDYGDVIFPSEPQDRQTIDQFLGDTSPTLAPSSISVSVIDGTDSASQTAEVGSSLSHLGYRVLPTSASDYVGPVSETTVLYSAGHLAQAQQVLGSLAGAVVLGEGKPVGGAEVSVIAGSDLAVAKASPTTPPPASSSSSVPPSSTSTSTSTTTTAPSASTSTTLATPASGNPNYGFNPASTPISPWDPRSCPASS